MFTLLPTAYALDKRKYVPVKMIKADEVRSEVAARLEQKKISSDI